MSFQIISPAIDIAVIAVALAIISMLVQIRFLNWKKTRQLQGSIKEKNKKAMELMKKGDESSKREAEELQKQVMQEMQAQFQNMPKQLIVSMIIFLPPFLLIQNLYSSAGFIITLGFEVPLLGAKWGWLKWYFVCAFISGIVINAIVSKLEKKGAF